MNVNVRLRPSSLLVMPAAAMVVHQARFTLAYGSRANVELAAQGHSYLHSVVPWTILALGVGASAFLLRAARAARTGDSGSLTRLSAARLWSTTTASLFAMQQGLLPEERFATDPRLTPSASPAHSEPSSRRPLADPHWG